MKWCSLTKTPRIFCSSSDFSLPNLSFRCYANDCTNVNPADFAGSNLGLFLHSIAPRGGGNMSRKHKRLAALIAASSVVAISYKTQAASFTWDGGGANNQLSNPVNWVADAAPNANDSLFF